WIVAGVTLAPDRAVFAIPDLGGDVGVSIVNGAAARCGSYHNIGISDRSRGGLARDGAGIDQRNKRRRGAIDGDAWRPGEVAALDRNKLAAGGWTSVGLYRRVGIQSEDDQIGKISQVHRAVH